MRSSILLLLLAVLPAAAQVSSPPPRFEDYPVHENWERKVPRIQFQSRADRMYRTQFINASREKPNFAGHYRLTTWGCGTSCLEGGIVNLSDGSLIPVPVSGYGDKTKWALCIFVTGGEYAGAAQTRVDSRLLITQCSNAYHKHDGGTYLRTTYYTFEHGKFRKIAEEIGKERVF